MVQKSQRSILFVLLTCTSLMVFLYGFYLHRGTAPLANRLNTRIDGGFSAPQDKESHITIVKRRNESTFDPLGTIKIPTNTKTLQFSDDRRFKSTEILIYGEEMETASSQKLLRDEPKSLSEVGNLTLGRSHQADKTNSSLTRKENSIEELNEARLYVRERFDKMTSSKPILLLTYMRSGSSWLGEITRQANDSIYFFEPFQYLIQEGYFTTSQVCFYNNTCRNPRSNIEKPLQVIEAILKIFACDMKNLKEMVLRNVVRHLLKDTHVSQNVQRHCMGKINISQVKNSTEIRGRSNQPTTVDRKPPVNLSSECIRIATEVCINAKQKIIKTIRLSMELVEILMNILSNLNVIHLVRDPRAITNSRENIPGLKNVKATVTHSKALCREMQNDLQIGQNLREMYPERMKLVVYEDLADNPFETVKTIYNFLDIQYNKVIQDWIFSSSHADKSNGKFGTKRESSNTTSSQWRRDLLLKDTLIVQQYCRVVMNMLGFVAFENEKELTNFSLSSRRSVFL